MQTCRALALLCIVPLAASCGEPATSEHVYVEDLSNGPVPDTRDFALRVTVLDYGGSVGGFVEYFFIDEVLNERSAPYFQPSACAYFGEGSVRNREFRIAAHGPGRVTPDGEQSLQMLIQAQYQDRQRQSLDATLREHGGVWADAHTPNAVVEPIRFIDDPDQLPDRSCPDSVPILEGDVWPRP